MVVRLLGLVLSEHALLMLCAVRNQEGPALITTVLGRKHHDIGTDTR